MLLPPRCTVSTIALLAGALLILQQSRCSNGNALRLSTLHQPAAPAADLQSARNAFSAQRRRLVDDEWRLSIGGRLTLTAQERLVDAHLRRLKRTEFDAGIASPGEFAPALHFFRARALIDRSPIYQLLQRMPKGAMLHGHNTAMASARWLVQNLTYHPNAMRCESADGSMVLSFRRIAWHNCQSGAYVRIVDERSASVDARQYDAELEQRISMFTEQPELEYPDQNAAWRRFNRIFRSISDLLTYEHTYRVHWWRLLQEMYDDRVMYLEVRTGFTLLYYDDNREVNDLDVVRELQAIVADFKRTHSSFVGVKYIYSIQRNTDDLDVAIAQYRRLKSEFPELIVGFDLVGQEDVGKSLFAMSDKVLANNDIDFMFHAGETDWNGYGSDRNILDAILLNATRIGHGYALYKHPVLMDLVRQRQICLEVCPISNQVLGLVHDMRNHPATVFNVLNVPMVIASDDPGFWGATGLSYDFYYALMSFTGVDTGLGYVKQLVLNSLRYSQMNGVERHEAHNVFVRQWQSFLEWVISTNALQTIAV